MEVLPSEPDDVALAIARHGTRLIENGSTIQAGIGKIPNAILYGLADKKDLGVHTEMFSDGLIDLIESGVVNNSQKTFHPGKILTTFCIGTRRLYDYIDNNPMFEFHPVDYNSSPINIAKNEKMVAINTALEVDITGQVCADSLGYRIYSGIGGQADFIRGAALAPQGKPIIALPSTAQGGMVSRIVPHLSEGAGVVTTRGDVHYVVDEYHRRGVGSHLLRFLMRIAREQGIRGFTATVITGNAAMMRVFQKSGCILHTEYDSGVISLSFQFDEKAESS